MEKEERGEDTDEGTLLIKRSLQSATDAAVERHCTYAVFRMMLRRFSLTLTLLAKKPLLEKEEEKMGQEGEKMGQEGGKADAAADGVGQEEEARSHAENAVRARLVSLCRMVSAGVQI